MMRHHQESVWGAAFSYELAHWEGLGVDPSGRVKQIQANEPGSTYDPS